MKIFIKNNKGVIILFLLNFMILFSLYNLMGGFEDFDNFLYFILLSLFNLLVYLILKYLNERKMYKSLEKKPEVFEDCLNSFGDSTLGKNLNEYTEALYSIYKYHMHENIKKANRTFKFYKSMGAPNENAYICNKANNSRKWRTAMYKRY